MIKKHMDVMTYALSACVLCTLGILLIWKQENVLAFFIWILGSIAAVQGISLFLKTFLKGNFQAVDSMRIIVDGIIACIFLLVPKIPMGMLTLLFACYLLVNGMAKGINAWLYFKNQAGGVFTNAVACIFYIVFAIILGMAPYMNVADVLLWIGIYCIALGITYLRDIISLDTKHLLKRKIRITLPIWMCALIPKKMLNELNEYLQDEGDLKGLHDQRIDETPDMMVYIHATEKGFGMIGHIDFSIDHKVYSYGNYDHHSFQLMEAIGDGVMFIADETPYLPFCIQHEENTIFAFGLHLEERQIKQIHAKLSSLYEYSVPWYPDIVNDPDHDYPQFSNQLYLATKASFYKYTKGPYRKYFVLGSNCVKFVDQILGASGSDILNLRGFVTPGTYLDYLQREYKKNNGFVISQSIYPYKKVKKGIKRHERI